MSHSRHLPARHTSTKFVAARFADPFPYFGTSGLASTRERAQKLCEAICYILHMPLPDENPTYMPADKLHAALYPRPDFVLYMERIMNDSRVSQAVVAGALFYIHLFRRSPEMRRPDRPLEPGCEWRITVVAVMLAHKFIEDAVYKNSSWATITGFTTQELHETEQWLLKCLYHDLFIGVEAYEQWLVRLARYVASRDRAVNSRSGRSVR
jgi:hypothetical protein